MARLVLFLISATLLMSCNETTKVRDISKALVKTSRGITTVNDTTFTGVLFRIVDGDTTEVRRYLNGKRSGVQIKWWSNGQMRSEYHFKENEFHGVCRDWSPDGRLVRQMNYVDGYESGLQQLWDDDGSLRANYEARNGRNYGLTGVKSCVTQVH